MPRRVRAPAGARKRRKASVTKRRNPTPGFNTPDPKILYAIKKNKVTFLYLIIEMLCLNIVIIIKKLLKIGVIFLLPKALHIFFFRKMIFLTGYG